MVFIFFFRRLFYLLSGRSRHNSRSNYQHGQGDLAQLPLGVVVYGRAVHVTDGDSFIFVPNNNSHDQFKIRLAGIDAPEMGKDGNPPQPLAIESKNFLQGMVNNQTMRIVPQTIDQYGRTVAIVFIDPSNINVNLTMVANGFAVVYRGRDATYGGEKKLFFQTQKEAKKKKNGVWGLSYFEAPDKYKGRMRKS